MSTSVGVSTTLQADFIETPSGRLFVLLYQAGKNRTTDIIVFLPPFGEEMNKSRRQVALSARTWCDLGFSVLVFDLYGTGDSAGEFGEASITRWRENIRDVLEWLAGQGFTSVTPWALRFGALFLPDLLRESVLPVNRAVLWQPVTSGKQSIQQFLRLQSAANLLSKEKGQTVGELQKLLSSGTSVEVAGYAISSQLYLEVQELDFSPVTTTSAVLEWFNISSTAQSGFPPAASRIIDEWQKAGIQVRTHNVTGDPFWSTTELATVPELTALTTALWAPPDNGATAR